VFENPPDDELRALLERARAAGMTVVMDRCIAVDRRRRVAEA